MIIFHQNSMILSSKNMSSKKIKNLSSSSLFSLCVWNDHIYKWDESQSKIHTTRVNNFKINFGIRFAGFPKCWTICWQWTSASTMTNLHHSFRSIWRQTGCWHKFVKHYFLNNLHILEFLHTLTVLSCALWLSTLQTIMLCSTITRTIYSHTWIWIAHQLNNIIFTCYFTTKFIWKYKKKLYDDGHTSHKLYLH